MLNRIQRFAVGLSGAFAALASLPSAQAPASPKPTCIRNVAMDQSGEDAPRASVVLRDGRISQILAADAATPAGMREIDGEGLICLPAFVDAFSYTGVVSPSPAVDQDHPVDVGADVRVDMRQANRKGIQPAFSVARALALEVKDSEAWREAGFGTAHINPASNLLGGTSCVAATREAAARDLILRADVFSSAAFAAQGQGYPQTLMGYIAQLRQFFMDAGRHVKLQARFEAQRPGARPAFDAELEAGAAILSGGSVLLCDVASHRDVERWFKLSDQFGFRLAFSGGNDAWRVADEIARRGVPMFLTLDWGKEVEDPLAKKKDKKDKSKSAEDKDEKETPNEEQPVVKADDAAAEVKPDQEEDKAEATEKEAEAMYAYDEPLAVRIDRRKEWEKRRDCALRLHEAGVPIAFGSGKDKPSKLIENARALVEAGLPADVALASMTSVPAELLGLGSRLGSVKPGFDATLTLWSADPFKDKQAKAIYIFVDGFETKYERPKAKPEKEAGGAPLEGLDVSGSWSVQDDENKDRDPTLLKLVMAEDGSITGELLTKNPADQSPLSADVSGSLNGSSMTLEATLAVGDMEVTLSYELEVNGDELSGDLTVNVSAMPEAMQSSVSGSRVPDSKASH